MNIKIVILVIFSVILGAGAMRLMQPEEQSMEVQIQGSANTTLLPPDKLELFSSADSTMVRWNKILLNAIADDQVSPPKASRQLAVIYRALEQGSKDHGFTGAALERYVDGAMAEAIRDFHPSMSNLTYSVIGSENDLSEEHIQGAQDMANAILLRTADGSEERKEYSIRDEPGYWSATPPYFFDPLLPHWGDIQLFSASDEDIELPAPPSIESSQYAEEFEEVYSLGGIDSTSRTPDQDEIAKYWADGKGTHTPPGHWNIIAGNVLAEENMSILEEIELFATLNTALGDAGIGAWKNKFAYEYWRPIDGILEANNDSNDATKRDESWFNYIETPNFPEYPSGHSAFSGAGATVLAHYFGDDTAFTSSTLGLPGVERSYSSFSEAAEEAGMSRIYGGIHFQSANTQGLKLGQRVAAAAIAEQAE